MLLTIVGPNLPCEAPGELVIHAAGCGHLNRGYCRDAEQSTEEYVDMRSVVESWYGPEAGSFYEERWDDDIPENAWEYYVNEFALAPCARHLPYKA